MIFSYEHALISDDEFARLAHDVQPELAAMRDAAAKGYDDPRASINLPFDAEMHNQVCGLAMGYADVELIVVVGIGGSNLGTMAVHSAVMGEYQRRGKRALYADTVDPKKIQEIAAIIVEHQEARKRTLIIGISKSGGTTETIANFEILVEAHTRAGGRPRDVVVISGEGSQFWRIAERSGYATLPIPAAVGGRYSVFSPVGLFPLTVIGVDTAALLDGARVMRDRCLQDVDQNPAAQSAILLKYHSASRNIMDLFLFAPALEHVGKWYRQLMGESIGKEHDRSGKVVWNGPTPTVSIGSTDLHSMAQLYLGGPQDKYTTFVTVQPLEEPRIPSHDEYEHLVPHIQGRPLGELMEAIVHGTQAAFRNGARPYSTITLPNTGEVTIGALLQFKMMEMLYLGALMNVNPFDQPAVEQYKVETKRLLQ